MFMTHLSFLWDIQQIGKFGFLSEKIFDLPIFGENEQISEKRHFSHIRNDTVSNPMNCLYNIKQILSRKMNSVYYCMV